MTETTSAAVVVVGSANVDLVASSPRMPKPGETISGTRFEQLFGGKGSNQAVAAALLGSSVRMVAKVGTDSLGESYLDNFRQMGVDTAHVGRTPEAATGVAQITVDDAGENVIIIVPGANGLLSAADVAAAGGAFDGARVLLTQLEVPVPTTVAALRAGRAAGLLTVFNSAPAPTAPLPPELFTLCDVVCPNETEAALMTGMPTETLAEAEAAARRIIEMGAKSVVMTLGSRGCMLVSPDEPKPLHVEVPPALRGAKVVDTTGAGDGFLGALAHFVAAGRPLADALAGAVHVASLSVQKRGAQGSYPSPALLPPELRVAPAAASAPAAAPAAAAVAALQLHKRSSLLSAVQQQKRAAARHAVDAEVRSGMVVGIGTGEAAGYALERLVERLGAGELSGVSCVPTSEKTEAEVRRLGVPCVSLDTQAAPAVAIGGADAVDGACNLIKGGKGALSREKLVQAEAARYVVVVDEPKLCARVGGAHPVPVEILPVFAQRTLRQIAALPALAPCDARLRYGDAPAGLDGVAPFPPKPFVTDNGNYVVDCFRQAPLDDVAAAAAALKATSGVVEHGLFVGAPSTVVVVGKADGGVDTFAGK